LGIVGAILVQSIRVRRAQLGFLLQQGPDQFVVAYGWESIKVPRAHQLVSRLFVHAVSLRLGQLFIQISELFGGNILLLVDIPNLTIPLVSDPRVFGFLNLDLKFLQLARQPLRGLGSGLIAALEVLHDKIFQMSVQYPSGQSRIGGLEFDVEKTAVRNALDAEVPQKGTQGWRSFLFRRGFSWRHTF